MRTLSEDNYHTKQALMLAMMYNAETDVPITITINGQSFEARMEKLEVVKYVNSMQDGFFIRGSFE